MHVQSRHVGIYGQWIDTWRPPLDSNELVLLLEDDITPSRFAYRWLKVGLVTANAGVIIEETTYMFYVIFLYRKVCKFKTVGWKQLQVCRTTSHPIKLVLSEGTYLNNL